MLYLIIIVFVQFFVKSQKFKNEKLNFWKGNKYIPTIYSNKWSVIMSTTVMQQTKYRDYNDFLFKHAIQKGAQTTNPKQITNTKIGDKEQNIYGGSYHIPDSEYSTFLKFYYNDVIKQNKKEYLTEKQIENGPLLVDIDIRHDYEIDERQYTIEHVEDLLDIYLEELKKIFQFDDQTKFQIYLLEKPSVNQVSDKKITKDGIHLIFGLQVDHITQQIIRQRVIPKVAEAWSDLPIKNSWEDVFDKCISQGNTNWQLFGSRKPNHTSYKLTHIYEIGFDEVDSEITRTEIRLSTFDIEKNIEKLSVRYNENPSFLVKNAFLPDYERFKLENNIGGGGGVAPASETVARQQRLELITDEMNSISKIRNQEELDFVLNHFLDNISIGEYELKDAYDYVMILPATFYEEGSYSKWIRVGWALRNISNKLLIVWIKFSSKATNFQYSSIPELCDRWRKMDLRNNTNGLTKLSIIHWARSEAKEAYNQVRRNTIDYFLELTINAPSSSRNEDHSGAGDFDLANVLFQLYKHEFVCVSVKANIWYHFKNHRWVEIDSGTTLRKSISIQLRDLYNQKSIDLMNRMTNEGQGNTTNDQLQANANNSDEPGKSRSHRILNICQRLSRTNDKKNIMTEAKEIFFDGSFLGKLDTNPYLLCFKNGVFDFKEKIFRNGSPEDNISMCTNIEYIELTPFVHQPIIDEINLFMSQLFPEPELCEYMWDHLASTLIGTTANQTFNMYIGIGQNGKSVLVNLMEKVLGEYKGDVPLTLVTDNRGKVGGLAPEIVQLKGKRFAVMQEPKKGDKMNEGIMKQYTSGKDPIQGRAPYMPQTISFIPQFKLVVTCNVLMEIKSNDHGTWRRIRAVPFKSLFTAEPKPDKEKPFQFKLVHNIDEKFDAWKEVFAALLVKRACETNGFVKDCSIVLEKSNEYRRSQDVISEFVDDKVIRCESKFISKNELNNEFAIWYASNYGGRSPPPKDLHEHMDKMYGRPKDQKWYGVKIKYDRDSGNDNLSNEFVSNSDDDIADIGEDDL
jgi:P4 family phage/plasmid primase-like protien